MACSLNCSPKLCGLDEALMSSKTRQDLGLCQSIGFMQIRDSKAKSFPVLSVDFLGKPLVLSNQKGFIDWRFKAPTKFSVLAQSSICVSKSLRWWEKAIKPNMVEIHSAQELVDSLANAGDRLVILDFYSPGCGGCRTLHPKICQLAESNPNAIFLRVNYEELRKMCQSLNIHVLPFFRFYRGSEGRLCSFSCTNATIKKFKDALAKHGTDRCGLGPAKGLDEAEILKLLSVGELSINFRLSSTKDERLEDLSLKGIDLPGFLTKTGKEEAASYGIVCSILQELK